MEQQPALKRALGTRDATLIVMGGIIGSGIFMNPSKVAKAIHSPWLVMLAWAIGGAIALGGAFIFAELAARRPQSGGVYAYLRDAFHPVVAFMYGWTLLLVAQSGGAAASAITFTTYFLPLVGITPNDLWNKGVAVAVIVLFTLINCLGVRAGATTQNAFMIAKIVAIGGIIAVGIFAPHVASSALQPAAATPMAAFGLALIPVFFAYLGWGTATFVSGEMREPQKTMPRGLLLGVGGITLLYLAINAVCLLVLGQNGLAATHTPASDVVQAAFGPRAQAIMSAIIAFSLLGFVGNQILTSPRVYFQMAADGVFFRTLAKVDPRTRVPVIAIGLQGAIAVVLALSGSYDTILNYVTSVDFIFFGLLVIALFIFRRHDREENAPKPLVTVPGHPFTSWVFLAISWLVVADVIWQQPVDGIIGALIVLSGAPVYWIYTRLIRR